MALHDLADPTAPMPSQLVLDSSLLLALRTGDDNPQAGVAHRFVKLLGARIADRKPLPGCLCQCAGMLPHRSWSELAPIMGHDTR